MADHIKFQDFPGLEIKILTLQTVWLTGAEVDPLTRLPRLPLASCCEAPTSHPIINEFIHSIVQNNDHTCIEEMILALAGQLKQLSHLRIRCLHRDSKPWNPVEVTWKISGAYTRQLLQSSSKCEGHFFNSSQRHTSETLLSMIMHLPHLALVPSQRPVLKQNLLELPLRLYNLLQPKVTFVPCL